MPPINIAIHMLNTAISRATKLGRTIVSITVSAELYVKIMQHLEIEEEPETIDYQGYTVSKDSNFKPIQMFVDYANS